MYENLFDIFNREAEFVSYIENLKGFKLNEISLNRYVVAKYVYKPWNSDYTDNQSVLFALARRRSCWFL